MDNLAAVSSADMGISGLPDLVANLLVGGLYVLVAELSSARFPLLAGGLKSAFSANQVCNVIVPSSPELFIRRVDSFDCFNTAEMMATNRLNFFVMQDEFPKKMFRFGADSFVKELEQFDIAENTYLLFDQADELLSLHDVSMALGQIEILRRWFSEHKVTALLVFSRSTSEQSSTINALMDHLTGIARLSGDRDGLEITFDYWQSSEGAVTAKNYPLLTLSSGLYEATTRTVVSSQVVSEERYERVPEANNTEAPYFYMDADLDRLAMEILGTWRRVETFVEMVRVARNARAATCILSFSGESDLQQLTEVVHTLRVSLGRHAVIVVREKETSIGRQGEALLLRLGTNLVIHRDVSVSNMAALFESLVGQIFKHNVENNFEAAVEEAFPIKQNGYLPILEFVHLVNVAVEEYSSLNIPCAMIIGKPTPSMVLVEVLASHTLTRPSDLIAFDDKLCYIFLSNCPKTDIVTTLEKMLGTTVSIAFEEPELFIHRDEIQPKLRDLLATETSDSLLSEISAREYQQKNRKTSTKPAVFSPSTSLGNNKNPVVPITLEPVLSAKIKTTQDTTFIATQTLIGKSEKLANTTHSVPKNAPSQQSNPVLEERTFSYEGVNNDLIFGKKEAPRATRSISK